MGKIVKICSSCDEGFAEKFGFCPNCGEALQAFEMNPVDAPAKPSRSASTKTQDTETVNAAPIVAPPPPPVVEEAPRVEEVESYESSPLELEPIESKAAAPPPMEEKVAPPPVVETPAPPPVVKKAAPPPVVAKPLPRKRKKRRRPRHLRRSRKTESKAAAATAGRHVRFSADEC